MIEENLLQYGVFGLWTICNILLIKYLLMQQEKRELKFYELVENNTKVLSSFLERQKSFKCLENEFKN